jgi:hypothetical protein
MHRKAILFKLSNVRARSFLIGLAVVLLASFSQVKVSNATGVIGKADLAGPWAITLIGNTGCGMSTMRATGTLNSAGVGVFTLRGHTTGCSDGVSTEKFTIQTLDSVGSGTAGLTCNNQVGCGWIFKIQVSPDRSMFNLVDLTDPQNLLEGVAIHQ